MLVLFIYVISLASNEIFNLSKKLIYIRLIIFILIIVINIILDKSIINTFNNNNEIIILNNLKSYLSENSLFLNKLYNYPTNIITIILINYLLLTLIIIVKITNIFYGPLRSIK